MTIKTVKNGYATKADLQELGDVLKARIDQLEKRLTGFDGRFDEVMTMLDEVMGEVKTSREEQAILSSQHKRVLDLEDKVEALERIHPHSQHAAL